MTYAAVVAAGLGLWWLARLYERTLNKMLDALDQAHGEITAAVIDFITV